MKPSEATVALTLAAAFDNRQVSEASAHAWAEVMPHVALTDAKDAIRHHFATSTDYLMTAHVIRIVAAMRAERSRNIDMPTPPRELADTPKVEAQWFEAFQRAILDGHEREVAIRLANGQFGIVPDPLAIESGADAIRDRMHETANEIARAKSIEVTERDAKREALRLFKAEREKSKATPTTTETLPRSKESPPHLQPEATE